MDVEEAWRRYFPLVREKAGRVLIDRDEANDVAQDTFIKLWRSNTALDDPRSVTAWLYRTATRQCIDRLRRRAVQLPEPAGGGEDPGPESASMNRQLLLRLSDTTPANELEAAVLARLDGLTHPEAAEVLGVSERTVRRLLTRFDERAKALAREVQP